MPYSYPTLSPFHTKTARAYGEAAGYVPPGGYLGAARGGGAVAWLPPEAGATDYGPIIGEGFKFGESIVRAIAGVDADKERAAKAAQAKAEADLAAARLKGLPTGGGALGWFGQSSFAGLPNWLLLGGAGLGAYLLLR